MSGYVVDASVIGPLLIPLEASSLNPRLRSILRSGTAVVPVHWWLEVASMGRKAVRKGNLTPAELANALAILARARVEQDGDTNAHAWTTTLARAEQHDLTIYDAAYLELAMRRGLPLLSSDNELRAAARAEGVELIDA